MPKKRAEKEAKAVEASTPVPKPESDAEAVKPMLAESRPFPPKRDLEALPSKIGIQIKDGKVDTDSMRGSTKEALRAVFEASKDDPELRKIIGVEPGIEHPEAVVTPQMIGTALDFFAAGESAVYSSRLRLPFDKVYKACAWQPHESEMLNPAGAAIANKYIPLEWRMKLDLLMFFSMLVGFSIAKYKAISVLAEQMQSAKASETPVPQPAKPNGSGESRASQETEVAA